MYNRQSGIIGFYKLDLLARPVYDIIDLHAIVYLTIAESFSHWSQPIKFIDNDIHRVTTSVHIK